MWGMGHASGEGAQTGILYLLPFRNPEKNRTHLCGDRQLSLSTLFTTSKFYIMILYMYIEAKGPCGFLNGAHYLLSRLLACEAHLSLL
jgi:hypothetical protein